MDDITLGELRRNFDELKAIFSRSVDDLRGQVVIREVYRAEQDHLKDRIKSLEASRRALIGTVTALSIGLLGEVLRGIVFTGGAH